VQHDNIAVQPEPVALRLHPIIRASNQALVLIGFAGAFQALGKFGSQDRQRDDEGEEGDHSLSADCNWVD
jgi:hypothetical protein